MLPPHWSAPEMNGVGVAHSQALTEASVQPPLGEVYPRGSVPASHAMVVRGCSRDGGGE